MGLWQSLYKKVISLSAHRNAPCYLAGVSVAESSFFPIPPDTLLIPMVMAKPTKSWTFAFITTASSVIGGMIGYAIGYFAFALVGQPIIEFFNAQAQFNDLIEWFSHWGVLVVFLAGVTPIPYKLFTLGAGMMQMSFPAFVVASIVGRSIRFYGVAAIMRFSGEKVDSMIVRYVDRLGWIALAVLLALIVLFKFVG